MRHLDNQGPIIFDIDGTIAINSSAHLHAFSRAVEQVLDVTADFELDGEAPYLNGQPISGFVDSQCYRLLADKRIHDESRVENLLPQFLTVYELEYVKLLDQGSSIGELVPGAISTLKSISDMEIPIGLSTGNAHFVAREKLRRLGVADFFEFDPHLGFGDFHLDRVAVVRAALSAFPKHSQGMLVGDTPRDMEAGRSNGLLSVGVETGGASRRELVRAGAQIVIKSLKLLPDLIDPNVRPH